jgi:hypothetical protein
VLPPSVDDWLPEKHLARFLGEVIDDLDLEALPEALGEVERLLPDHGYFSAGNVGACEKADIEPVIAMCRQPQHPPLSEGFDKAPHAPQDPTPVEAMAYRLKTPAGRALYALRKQTPEQVRSDVTSSRPRQAIPCSSSAMRSSRTLKRSPIRR